MGVTEASLDQVCESFYYSAFQTPFQPYFLPMASILLTGSQSHVLLLIYVIFTCSPTGRRMALSENIGLPHGRQMLQLFV